MGRLFHSFGAALKNALTPKWVVFFVCLLFFVCFFVLFCFLGRHRRCEDEIGWRTADDTVEGSEVLASEDTCGLCHSCSCTQETGFCSQYVFQQVASVAHGE